jgi:hypothetical protein
MIKPNNYFNKYHLISFLFLALSLFLFFNPKIQSFFNQLSKSNERVVLSKIETTKLNDQLKFTIIKIKQSQRLYLEIYAHMNHGLELLEKLILDGEFDAYLMLKDRSSNLVISNVDGDTNLEIVAPTYDKRMRPILNVFKYDSQMEEFRKVNSKFSKPIL